jgi:hypothetical protein
MAFFNEGDYDYPDEPEPKRSLAKMPRRQIKASRLPLQALRLCEKNFLAQNTYLLVLRL